MKEQHKQPLFQFQKWVPTQYLHITGQSVNFKLYQNMHLFQNCFVCKMLEEHSFTVLANYGMCLKSWQSNVLWDFFKSCG